MCENEPPTATQKVKIVFHMQQVWYAKNRRGWIPPLLVARGLTTVYRNMFIVLYMKHWPKHWQRPHFKILCRSSTCCWPCRPSVSQETGENR